MASLSAQRLSASPLTEAENTSATVKYFLSIQRHFFLASNDSLLKTQSESSSYLDNSLPVDSSNTLPTFSCDTLSPSEVSPSLPAASPPPLTTEQLSDHLRLHVLAHRYIRQGMIPPADLLRRIFSLMEPSVCEYLLKKPSIINALQNPLEGITGRSDVQLRDRLRLLDLLSNPSLYEVLSCFVYLPSETLHKIATERKLLNFREFQKDIRLKVMEKSGQLGRPLQHDFLRPESALSFSDISSLLPLNFCNYFLWDRLNPLNLKTGRLDEKSKQFYPEAIRVSAVRYVFHQREHLDENVPLLAENFFKMKTMRFKSTVPQRATLMQETWKERRLLAHRLAFAASAHISSVELKRQQLREKQQRERMRLLKDNDIVKYMEMVKQTKNKRLHELLESTEVFLKDMGSRVSLQKHSYEASSMNIQETSTQGGDLPKWKETASNSKAISDEKKSIGEKYYKLSHEITEQITQPPILVGGILMPYQLTGLEWLVSLFNNNLHGILADEMGLGKTIQTIALFAYLKEFKNCRGPHLVIVPLSTIPNWATEFQKWCPSINIMQFRGGRLERKVLIKDLRRTNFDVCLTTFDFIIREKGPLSSPPWRYIIVDEGHRMKNVKSKFHMTLNDFRSSHRLLLTGTPLQNNITELWSLLNFLLPKIFSSAEDFEKWFSEPFQGTGLADTGQTMECLNEEEQMLIINRLHSVLRPFLLRRVKTDVLEDLPDKLEFTVRMELSAWQKAYYKQIQERAFR
ncbi:SWI2/SNF2 ISWI-like SANT [Cardiosporidium cionae]|uniref:SWI2/SNF2 ISWI-like SANT n=1 Tax=Cardiosporidium cionae TaxID=476202 RepID=A0ABQ7J5W9_9APIC|nr:SWI2/SNF2 ISWI-like SANT [Cardiosporidium cionae]|eukprot:KAF8819394.1 SWI2/SNF2 ISWI-like SANT [Cardiosporidium cionae]